jgi:hypothetical protein
MMKRGQGSLLPGIERVFDPTGRLCGVFSAPPGRTSELAFDGDRQFALADGKSYVRQMLAEGKNK